MQIRLPPMLPSPVTVLGLLPSIALSSELAVTSYHGKFKGQVIRTSERRVNHIKKKAVFLKSVLHLSMALEYQGFQNLSIKYEVSLCKLNVVDIKENPNQSYRHI